MRRAPARTPLSGLVLVGLLCLNGSMPAQADVPAGSRSTYRMRVVEATSAGDRGERRVEFEVVLYRIDRGRRGIRTVVLLRGEREAFPSDLPVGAISETGQGERRVELEHPDGRLISRFVTPALFEPPPADRLQAPTEGKDRLLPASLPIRRKLSVTYSTVKIPEREGRIRYRCELAEPFVSDLGVLRLEVREFVRDLILDSADGRIVEGSFRQALQKTFEAKSETESLTLEFEEIDREPLTTARARTVSSEYAHLARIARQVLPGRIGGGAAAKPRRKPEALLADYRQEYPEGELARAAEWLEKSLVEAEEARRLADPKRSATTLIGEIAPDFTLRDLQGRSVSLSDLEGKAVILYFWSST